MRGMMTAVDINSGNLYHSPTKWKKNNFPPRTVYPAKLSFKMKGKIKTSQINEKRAFTINKSLLKEIKRIVKKFVTKVNLKHCL